MTGKHWKPFFIVKMNWVRLIKFDIWINHHTYIIWDDPNSYYKVQFKLDFFFFFGGWLVWLSFTKQVINYSIYIVTFLAFIETISTVKLYPPKVHLNMRLTLLWKKLRTSWSFCSYIQHISFLILFSAFISARTWKTI